MKTICLDSEFRCHDTDPEGIYREVTLSDNAREFFNNKCIAFVEGYRLKPAGETWVRDDGEVFSGGEMITPWRSYSELEAAQAQYEAMLAEMDNAYAEGVASA